MKAIKLLIIFIGCGGLILSGFEFTKGNILYAFLLGYFSMFAVVIPYLSEATRK